LSHPTEALLIGVGRPVENLVDLRESHDQATETLAVAHALGQQEGVLSFDDLGVLHWLRHLPPDVIRGNVYMAAVQQLAEYDTEHDTHFIQTLEVYLDAASVADAAANLYVHRNTLAYRLERIERLIHVDLSAPHHRLNLHVALKCFRLNNTKN
jgi:DNA-binding PucR family transcriptional regulator